MNTHLKILLYIGLVVGIFYFVQNKYSIFEISFNDSKKEVEVEQGEEQTELNSVEILNSEERSIIVEIEIADNPGSRSSGLSGRSTLGDYQGMLFIFDREDSYSFWMQGMLIPLDIVFIDSKGAVVDIRKNELPCTKDYCPSIMASQSFKYALEVNSGFCRINKVDIGNEVIFNISSEN